MVNQAKTRCQVRLTVEDKKAGEAYAKNLYGVTLSQLLRVLVKMLIDEKLELLAVNIKRDGAGNVLFQEF